MLHIIWQELIINSLADHAVILPVWGVGGQRGGVGGKGKGEGARGRGRRTKGRGEAGGGWWRRGREGEGRRRLATLTP